MLDSPALLRPHPPVVGVGHPDESVHGVVDVVQHFVTDSGLGQYGQHRLRVALSKVAQVVLHVEVDILGPGPLGSISAGIFTMNRPQKQANDTI